MGASIACSGVCLTVVDTGVEKSPWFAVETAVNRQRIITGGAATSCLSLTVLDS